MNRSMSFLDALQANFDVLTPLSKHVRRIHFFSNRCLFVISVITHR